MKKTQIGPLIQAFSVNARKLFLGEYAIFQALIFTGILGFAWVIASCIIIIPQGSFGIIQSTDGHIIKNKIIPPGLRFSFPYKYLVINAEKINLKVTHLHPKDVDGATIEDVDLGVNYQIDPAKVPGFFSFSSNMEMDGQGRYVLGHNLLRNSIIPNVVQNVAEKSISANLASHPSEFAHSILQATNELLNKQYPNHPFIIQSITIQNFVLPESIQQQIAARTAFDAQLLTIDAEKRVVEAKQVVTQEKAIVSASALAQAAKTTGLSVDQIISWERVQALKDLAKQNGKSSVTVLDR